MKSQWLIFLSCLAIAVAGMVTLTSEAQAGRITPHIPVRINSGTQVPQPPPEKPPINVRCVGRQTVAENGERQSVLITSWSKTYFGDSFTPERRCQIVSAKLQKVVAANGGRFKNIRFLSRIVENRLVVCVVGGGQIEQLKCNYENMLFTLKPENRDRVGQILEELTNFRKSVFNTPVGDGMFDIEYVDICDLDQELEGFTPSDAPQPSGSAPHL
jgi:hypothetical protein